MTFIYLFHVYNKGKVYAIIAVLVLLADKKKYMCSAGCPLLPYQISWNASAVWAEEVTYKHTTVYFKLLAI